jgi:hypothetical protein
MNSSDLIGRQILNRDYTAPVLDQLDLLLRDSRATDIVLSLVESSKPPEATPKDAVDQSMQALEALAKVAATPACLLMVALSAIADSLFMHDVVDSVRLWIDANMSPGLKSELSRLALSEHNPTTRKYMAWIVSRYR